MTFYGQESKEMEFDYEIEDDEILEYIQEDRKRLQRFRAQLEVDPLPSVNARSIMDNLKPIDRDAFLADLARECALLGVEWPPSCKEATRVTHRQDARVDLAGE
jgi:hypothetical protein